MKTMTCRQLGGACEMTFSADTFAELAEMSKNHGTVMFKKGDPDHLKAMEKMGRLMQDPEAMDKWFEARQKEFDSLPDEDPTGS